MRKEVRVILSILILLLFITAHFLTTIYYYSGYIFLCDYTDIALFLAIILQLILVYEEVRR